MTELQGRRVLVTGGAGTIGRATVALLRSHGAKVTVLTNVAVPAEVELAVDRIVIGDATKEPDVAEALTGVELVVHLAALAHPTAGTPYEVYATNVVATFNVLAQCGALGINRAVIASSINAVGIPMNSHDVTPAYFPIDAHQPADLDDWYSLSKFSDEHTAAMVHRRWGTEVIALRFPFVSVESRLRAISEVYRSDPGRGMREGWSYLDVRDAARAVVASLRADVTGMHRVQVAADTTLAPYPTEALLDAYAPGVHRIRRFVGREVPIDLTPIRTLLGFRAEHELDLPTLSLG